MIYDTLAAIADYNNNHRIDNDASVYEIKEEMDSLAEDGKMTNSDDIYTMNLSNGKTRYIMGLKTYAESYFIDAIQHKTPRSEIESDMGIFDGKVVDI